jgi:hypothetical protein
MRTGFKRGVTAGFAWGAGTVLVAGSGNPYAITFVGVVSALILLMLLEG